jgi:hypothetical protein
MEPFIAATASFVGTDQVGRWWARVGEGVGVNVFETGHGQVAGTTEAGGARTIGADPEGGKPAEGTRSKERDGVGRRIGCPRVVADPRAGPRCAGWFDRVRMWRPAATELGSLMPGRWHASLQNRTTCAQCCAGGTVCPF